MNRQVQINGLYRHFKGNIYRVLGLAKHTETNETLVIYICYDINFPNSAEDYDNIYAQPIEMFLSEVNHNKYPDAKQKYRFELILMIYQDMYRKRLDSRRNKEETNTMV